MSKPAISRRSRHLGWLWLIAALSVLHITSAWASLPLAGTWREVQAHDTPQLVLQDHAAGRLRSFDPAHLQQFPASATGIWVVFTTQPPWDNRERVLTVYPPPWREITAYGPGLVPAQTLSVTDSSAPTVGHGRLAWRLPADQAASAPILLKLAPSAVANAPVRFKLQPLGEFLQQDTAWVIFASACLAAMLTMALMALCFALMLRDIAYAWYAGYILCYALIQGTETGFVFHSLGWQWLVASVQLAHFAAVALSVAFAALFVTRFCGLQRHAPMWRVPVLALAVGMSQLVLLRASNVPLLLQVERALFTPLLTLGALLLLVVAIVAVVRGSRSAWFFLAGWVPLLLLTAAANAQARGNLLDLGWLADAKLVAGAFEAIVLSLGLADRALSMRQDRDEVRALADNDALTGVFNRRAWNERAGAALATLDKGPTALLFLDLDYFKALNDRLGHHSGDRALIAVAKTLKAELRPADLLGRYGGEEFVALLAATTTAQAIDVAMRLCRRVHRLDIAAGGDGTMLTASIGIAIHQPSDSLEALVERADQAMYSAKLNGRNQVVLYQARTPAKSPHLRALERRQGEN
ncbi:MAG TPA: diguanylate cyclase [Rhodanobacter sp.]|nr:diguanylate cyclase [Rhodanobacter sp.]